MCVGIYGVYDLTAAWHTDLVTRPNDRPAEKSLGVRLIENRKIYFDVANLLRDEEGQD